MKETTTPVSSITPPGPRTSNARVLPHLAALGALLLFLCGGDWRDDSVTRKRYPGSGRTASTTKSSSAPQDGIERFGGPTTPPATQQQPEGETNQPPQQPVSTIPFDNPTSEDLSNQDEY